MQSDSSYTRDELGKSLKDHIDREPNRGWKKTAIEEKC